MGLAVMFEALAKHCGQESIDSLRIVESGGMYTQEETNSSFLKHFGKPIYSVWGSTETSGVAIANSPRDFRIDGSMGKACPHYEVKLMDNGREVGPGEVGELFFRGPGVVSGYENDASMLDHQGWYASGDLAKKDKAGFYYFMDRRSGMIKFAGLKIYPMQIENVLLKHPAILEAAVLGVSDHKKGAVPKAYIKVNGSETDIADILNFCKEHLPQYMIPKSISVLDDLPKIGSGKINKKALSDIIQS
jgi:long-chain acyl-CoA synthetase